MIKEPFEFKLRPDFFKIDSSLSNFRKMKKMTVAMREPQYTFRVPDDSICELMYNEMVKEINKIIFDDESNVKSYRFINMIDLDSNSKYSELCDTIIKLEYKNMMMSNLGSYFISDSRDFTPSVLDNSFIDTIKKIGRFQNKVCYVSDYIKDFIIFFDDVYFNAEAFKYHNNETYYLDLNFCFSMKEVTILYLVNDKESSVYKKYLKFKRKNVIDSIIKL
jgi:hypothetical protein